MKKVFSVLLCLLLLAAFNPTVAFAKTKEEALAEREELQRQLIEINARLAEIRDDVEKAKAKAESLGERLRIVEEQIALIVEAIELAEEELALRQRELDLKIAEREETFNLFKGRIREMYMSNDVTDLSMLLGVSSYSDFLLESEYLRRMSEYDRELINKLIEEELAIEQAKKEVEDTLTELETAKADLDTKRYEWALLKSEADQNLSVAQALEDQAKDDQAAIIAALNKQEAEWGELMGTGMPNYVGGYYSWPVPGFGWISSGYGPRTLYGVYNMHRGIDIAGGGIYGRSVVASNDGKVVRVQYATTGYGYHVMIDHGGNQWTVYAHLSAIYVSVGQWVGQGQSVGAVGSTGNSTGPHLHFEIRVSGVQIDPMTLVRDRP